MSGAALFRETRAGLGLWLKLNRARLPRSVVVAKVRAYFLPFVAVLHPTATAFFFSYLHTVTVYCL